MSRNVLVCASAAGLNYALIGMAHHRLWRQFPGDFLCGHHDPNNATDQAERQICQPSPPTTAGRIWLAHWPTSHASTLAPAIRGCPSWRRIQRQRKAAITAWNQNKVSTASAVAPEVRAKASANSFQRNWGQKTQPISTTTKSLRMSSPALVSNYTPGKCSTCRCVKTCLFKQTQALRARDPILTASAHHVVREYAAVRPPSAEIFACRPSG